MIGNIDPLLLRMVGQRLSPLRNISRVRYDGFEDLAIINSQILNVKILGGEVVKPSYSAGQSIDLSRAISAAIGEALERHGGTCPPFQSTILHGCFADLHTRHPLFPLEDTWLFSREQISTQGFDLRNVEAEDAVDWLKGVLYETEEPRDIYFPLSRITLDSKLCDPFDISTSNGFALGSSFAEACQSALCEYLERAAFLETWWLKRSPNLFTFEDCLALPMPSIHLYAQWLGSRLHVLDLSDTWGVPTFICAIRGRGDAEPVLTVSGAAHAHGPTALRKSIEETMRIFLGRIEGVRPSIKPIAMPFDDSLRTFEDIENLYWSKETSAWAEFLFAGQRLGAEFLKRRLASPAVSIRAEVLKRGGRILAFDLTPIDLAQAELSLARVIVPDAIPLNVAHKARPWGCPRLRAFSVADLNPMPHPFL